VSDTRWAADRDRRGGSFGAVAADYAAWRPGYPAEIVAFLAGGDEDAPRPRRILDLGAGTGLLTEALVAAGHDVVAADVSADMLTRLAERLPQVPTLVARAEQLPLPDGDVDVVVAAQAAHWFDPPAASREFRRVLRASGAVGFVWNTRDDRAPWAAELAALLAEGTRDQTGDRPEGNRAVVEAFAAELDAEVASRTTAWAHRVPPEAVVGRAASSSRVALLAEDERAAYLDRVRRLVDTHPDTRGRARLDLDYTTTAWRLVPR
jgi:ubiquinone/menaquinone biosynthesis C-methylase UbiE